MRSVGRCTGLAPILMVCVLLTLMGEAHGTEHGEGPPIAPAKPGLVYTWFFDETNLKTNFDTKDHWNLNFTTKWIQDAYKGNFKFVEGVRDLALKLDGISARIQRTAIKVPNLANGFSIQAWIAPQARRAGTIMAQEENLSKGFIFGLNDQGQLALNLALDGEWVGCASRKALEPLKWTHVGVSYQPNDAIRLYINGKEEGVEGISGRMLQASQQDLFIGMTLPKIKPPRGGTYPNFRVGRSSLSGDDTEKRIMTRMFFDGLMDEVLLYTKALSPEDMHDVYKTLTPANPQPLKPRILDLGPDIPNPRFGASYGRLAANKEYEEMQRFGPTSDILVRFDEHPIRVLFHHTRSFTPIWITENKFMMSDQSLEINDVNGWYEVFSDRQNRYAHVRLLENHDARVVVHWRYALVDYFYGIARPDEITGWGDWADEYYTIYPDGVAVRHWVYWTSTYAKVFLQFQETIPRLQPGQTREDILELEAMTLANLKGEIQTYSWEDGIPPQFPLPRNAHIQLVNMKSDYRPFIIFEPGSAIDKYIWDVPGNDSHFPCCIASGSPVIHKGETPYSYKAAALYGLSNNGIDDLVELARSWASPAVVESTSRGYSSEGYDMYQRAFVFAAEEPARELPLEFSLRADDESPLYNPAFVVKNWGHADATVEINGETIPQGKHLRIGHRSTMSGADLVVWIDDFEDAENLRIRIMPQE